MKPLYLSEDIAELIVKEVERKNTGDDKIQDLALVSKAFVDPVRRCIFRTIELNDEKTYSRFMRLSESFPHILRHIREFRLHAHQFLEEPELPEIINHLVNVRNLWISFRQPRPEPRGERYPEFHGEEDTDDDDEEDTEEVDAPQNTESGPAELVPYKVVWGKDVAQDIDASAGDSFSWNQNLSGAFQGALDTVLTVPTLEYMYLEEIYDIPRVHIKSMLRIPEVSLNNIGFAQDYTSDLHDLLAQNVSSDYSRIRSLTVRSLSLETLQPFIEAMPPSTLKTLHVTNIGQDNKNVDVAQTIIDTQRLALTTITIGDDETQLNLHNVPNLHSLHITMNFWGSPLVNAAPTIRTINPNNHIKEFKVFMDYSCFCLVASGKTEMHN